MHKIWKEGMEACSAKALSEHMGMTRSSFYNAFGSREELFKEALNLYFSQTPDKMLADIEPGTAILPVITSMFKEVCRIRAADTEAKGCMAINCVTELVGVDENLGPVMERAIQHSLERLEGLLRLAAQNGEISDNNDLRDKALALQNLLVGINVMSKVVRTERDLWVTVKQTLRGLGLFRE